ncbi:nuclear envelope integral membrane protein 1 [Galendromus occidentalis]|uniref:Nuclear envelope integral membrane protein 1 n=1 Tax=Galendromus occidentalis TaxID=34638 RepID=A0AAJ6QYM4_9ACAR|nr:nuclear envelope integral membrane protein 1 [Galendromus occidentalis]
MFCGRVAVIVLVAGLSRAATQSEELKPNYVYYDKGEESYPRIYCYGGRPFTYLGVFASARVEFTLPPTFYDLYEGANETEVDSEFQENKRNWLPLVPWRSNTIPFRAFERKCIGLLSSSEYRFKFRSFNIDYLRMIMCAMGLMLFFNAHRIVRSKSVFYSGGVSVGVVASLLVIFFFLSRMIPRRRTMLVSLLMGWSFSVYIFHKLWTNLYEVLHEHRAIVFTYLGVAATISFALCYRCGPPTNEKTIDLMQWSVQFMALAVVYLSSDIQEVTLAFCLVALLIYNIPREYSAKVQTFVKKKIFKPKVKLLSEEEFIRQGDEFTRLELERLRKFAQSPDCPAWKVMSKLKNPQRFGSFVMGESHLEDNEILDYETSARVQEDELTLLTDDESDEENYPRILPTDLLNGDGPNNASRQRR